jgi:hypothetical protein
VHLTFVELRARLGQLVADSGLHETLGREHFYPTIEATLADISRLDTGPAAPDG